MDLSNKQRNLNGAILFIQQEHATTLKALHEEISNLQKRCSELTFQVAMSNTSISQEVEFRDKCQLLENDLANECKKKEGFEREVELKDKRISFLEQKIKSHDRKIHDLKDSHRQTLQDLQSQLNTKSDAIATLNSKLHHVREQQSQQRKLSSDMHRSLESQTSSASSSADGSPRLPKPAPPKDGMPRRFRRQNSQNSEQSATHVPVPPLRPTARHIRSSRKLPEKPQTPENIPDPTPFLSRDEEGLHLAKRERTVLPPISKRLLPNVLSPQKSDSLTFLKKGLQNVDTISNSSPEVEIETLAMTPVSKSEHHLHQTQNCNKTD